MPLLQAKTSDEFFISIAQQGVHSFVMLGVVVEGKPQLIARVGKVVRDNQSQNGCKTLYSSLFSQVGADIKDEGITRSSNYKMDINYSTYAITYEQTLDFLAFLEKANQQQAADRLADDTGCCIVEISEIEQLTIKSIGEFDAGYVRLIHPQKQLNELHYFSKQPDDLNSSKVSMTPEALKQFDKEIARSKCLSRLSAENLKRISELTHHNHLNNAEWHQKYRPLNAYKPTPSLREDTFLFRYTSDSVVTTVPGPREEKLYKNTQGLNIRNTCRHTAIELVDYTRAAPTPYHISKQFFKSLPLHTTLVAGRPSDTRPFYILPLPPTLFPNDAHNPASNKKQVLLTKLYRRMEELASLERKAFSPLTQEAFDKSSVAKFEKLKKLYNTEAQQNRETPEAIMCAIRQWRTENPDIGALRNRYFFDDWLAYFGQQRINATDQMLNEFAPKVR